ncbi:MAG TPA: hypothetical protein VEY07_02890 [Thermoplasmata archaeon]|nr:hypothetical protein [Thermoplasmata archaeon]
MMYPPTGLEDPISAIFDLSDRVADMAPTMRRMYRYTATVVVLFLVIMIVLLFVGLAANLFFALLALAAIVFGAIALSLLRETDRFYQVFLERHRSIKLLQDAEPSPKVPAGPTPVQRLARYLVQSNARLAAVVSAHPEYLRYRVNLDPQGSTLPFDLVLRTPSPMGSRVLGWGEPGFAVVARLGPENPTLSDLERFGADVAAYSRKTATRVVRAILVRVGGGSLPEPVYDYAVGHPLELRRGRVTLEVVSELPDGTYDFVPHVLGVP